MVAVNKEKERKEIFPDITKRMSLNRFFAAQRDVVNDELEAFVPDLIEDALENPTGTYQRVTNKTMYRLDSINKNTKAIKKDTDAILTFLKKDLQDKLDSMESGGGGGIINSILSMFGLGAAGATGKSMFEKFRGNKPPVAKPSASLKSPNAKTGRYTVSDLPPEQQKKFLEQGRRPTEFIKNAEAAKAGLLAKAETTAVKAESTLSKIGASISGFFSGVGKAIGNVVKVGGKVLKITAIAALIWDAWSQLSKLPKPTNAEEEKIYRRDVVSIVSMLVTELGFAIVGAAFGELIGMVAGSVVPVAGNAIGAIVGTLTGLVAGIALDAYYGDDVAAVINSKEFKDLVDSIIGALMSSNFEEKDKQKTVDAKVKQIIRNAAVSDPYKNLSDEELASKGLKRAGTQNIGRGGTANLYETIGAPSATAAAAPAGGSDAYLVQQEMARQGIAPPGQAGTVSAGSPGGGGGGGVPSHYQGAPVSDSDGPTASPTEETDSGVTQTYTADNARQNVETYLGRKVSDQEYDYLIRATHAESGAGKKGNQQEQAMIMASILNRARTKGENGIIKALEEKNQFQSVTGTKYNRAPSQNFTQGPGEERRVSIEGSSAMLGAIPQDQKNFTAANRKAYGPGTNPKYLDDMLAAGGTVIGGSVFNTSPDFSSVSGQEATATAVTPGKAGPGGRYDASYYEAILNPYDLHSKTRKSSISGLDMEMKARLGAMLRDAPDYVKNELKIQSAFRDQETQNRLKAAAGRSPYVATHSQHSEGRAVDLGSGSGSAANSWKNLSQDTKDWIAANSEKYGLYRPMQPGRTSIIEDWHFEPIGNRSGKANQPKADMTAWQDPMIAQQLAAQKNQPQTASVPITSVDQTRTVPTPEREIPVADQIREEMRGMMKEANKPQNTALVTPTVGPQQGQPPSFLAMTSAQQRISSQIYGLPIGNHGKDPGKAFIDATYSSLAGETGVLA